MEFTDTTFKHEVKAFIGHIILSGKKEGDNIIINLVTPFGTKKKIIDKKESKEFLKKILKWIA